MNRGATFRFRRGVGRYRTHAPPLPAPVTCEEASPLPCDPAARSGPGQSAAAGGRVIAPAPSPDAEPPRYPKSETTDPLGGFGIDGNRPRRNAVGVRNRRRI